MDACEWFQFFPPLNFVTERLQTPALLLFQHWKGLQYAVSQCCEEFRQPFLRGLENIPRELPVVSALFDNHKVICLVEALPDFAELQSQQMSKQRSYAHVGEVISLASYDASARRIVAMFGMIQRLLHEPRKRLRAVILNPAATHLD